MAPVTATTTGIACQTIDDPNLLALIERLSKFDPQSNPSGVRVPATDANDGDVIMADDANNNYSHGESPMATSATGDSESAEKQPQPPLDVDGLVAELDGVPKWRFQELVRIHHFDLQCASSLHQIHRQTSLFPLALLH
jgi:hypothetical protein